MGCSYVIVLGDSAQPSGFFRAPPAHFYMQSALVGGGSETPSSSWHYISQPLSTTGPLYMLSPLPRTLCLHDRPPPTLSGHFSPFFRPPLKCRSLWGALRPPTRVRVSGAPDSEPGGKEPTLRLSSGFHVERGGREPCRAGQAGWGQVLSTWCTGCPENLAWTYTVSLMLKGEAAIARPRWTAQRASETEETMLEPLARPLPDPPTLLRVLPVETGGSHGCIGPEAAACPV